MIEFQINLTDIEDLKTLQQSHIAEQFAALARDHLRNCGRVTIKRLFMNAPADTVASFTQLEEFNAYWQRMFST